MLNLIRKYKILIIWLAVAAYLVFAKVVADNILKNTRIKSIEIVVSDSLMHNFIDKQDVLDLLKDSNIVIKGKLYDSVNTLKIENIIRSQSVVKNAEVYATYDGKLHINIVQRTPIVRIITYDKDSYFIGEEGHIIPYNPKNSSRVIVASGKIDAPLQLFSENFNVKNSRMMFYRDTLLKSIYEISKFIYEDEFWKNNIEQIYVFDENEFHLIPKVGSFFINFGDIKDFKDKFKYLEVFYKDVLPKVGWNRYSEIDLRYDKQIICRKNN